MQDMIVDGIAITVSRKKIKNLYINIIKPNNSSEPLVRVSVPKNSSNIAITAFIESKISWIKKHHSKITAQTLPVRQDFHYETGETHYFYGKPYQLNVIYGHGVNKVELDESTVTLKLFVSSRGRLLLRKRVLNDWYKSQMNLLSSDYIKRWQELIGVEITEYSIRSMKSRWGSCNITKKRICLNLELVKRPQECLEYIIVHELVHLLERHHNKRFYQFMRQFMPQWREYDKKLYLF